MYTEVRHTRKRHFEIPRTERWIHTSNPFEVRKPRSDSGVVYSPSGTKLNEERNPRRISISANWRQRSNPLLPSTSCVRTKANSLPSGHPSHPSGALAATLLIGQELLNRRLSRPARKRRNAIRSTHGMVGLSR